MTEAQDRHTVFVSYSWDSEEHKQWVLRVAEVLDREPDIDVTFDQFDVWAGKDLTHFMERGLGCERVVVVSTPTYVRKSRERVGGVGYECSLITADLVKDMKQDRFIPVLRAGEDVPAFLGTKLRLDFRDDGRFEESIERLIAAIRREPEARRPEKRVLGSLMTNKASLPPDVSHSERGRTSRPQIVLEGHFAHREMQGRRQGMHLHNVGDGVALEVQVEPLGHEPKWMMFGKVAVLRPHTNPVEVPITFVDAADVFEVGAYISMVSTLRAGTNSTDDVAAHDAYPLRIIYRDREGTEYVSDEYELHFHEPKPFIAANAYYEVQRRRGAPTAERIPTEVRESDPRTTLTMQQLGEITRVVSNLRDRIQPRTLDEGKRSELIELLRDIEASPLLVSAMSNDTEAQRYRDQIGEVFEAAGWPTSIRHAITGRDVSDVALYYYTGPSTYPHIIPPPPSNAVQISTAFAAVGILVPVEPVQEFAPGHQRLHFVVGQKPTL